MPLNDWERLLEDLKTRRIRPKAREDVPRAIDWVGRFHFERTHRAVLIVTKDWLPRLFEREGSPLPSELGLIERYGLATPEFSEVLARIVAPWKVPVVFVGDLDPFDLACFRALVVGNPQLRPRRPKLRIGYAGVDSNWLARSRRLARLPNRQKADVTLAMSDFERLEWAALRSVWPGVIRVIGKEAAASLDGGRTLDVIGASNPQLYPKSHLHWVRKRVLEAAGFRNPGQAR